MEIKIIERNIPKERMAYISSLIGFGNEQQTDFKFELEGDKIIMPYDRVFYWAEGKDIKDIVIYIQNKEEEWEKEESARLERIKKHDIDWDIKYKKEQILIQKWKDENWVCMEGGDGYYDWKGFSEYMRNGMKET